MHAWDSWWAAACALHSGFKHWALERPDHMSTPAASQSTSNCCWSLTYTCWQLTHTLNEDEAVPAWHLHLCTWQALYSARLLFKHCIVSVHTFSGNQTQDHDFGFLAPWSTSLATGTACDMLTDTTQSKIKQSSIISLHWVEASSDLSFSKHDLPLLRFTYSNAFYQIRCIYAITT